MPLDPRARRLLDMLALARRPDEADGVPMSAAERRAGFAALMALSRPAIPMPVEEITIAGDEGPLPARRYGPADDGPGLVFFHGGGLVAGDLDTHDALCRRLAQESGARVIAIGYRRAPEHPFPAAPRDARAAMADVRARAGTLGLTRLAVGGDSAGGTLATLVAGAFGPALAFQLLLCPVLDLADRRPSRHTFGTGYMLDQSVIDRDLADYLPPGVDPADPQVSPLHNRDLSGMPRTLLHTAEYDPLHDEGADYAAALRAAGVPVAHTCHAGLIHHFLGLEGVLPQARPALAAIGAEMRAAFG